MQPVRFWHSLLTNRQKTLIVKFELRDLASVLYLIPFPCPTFLVPCFLACVSSFPCGSRPVSLLFIPLLCPCSALPRLPPSCVRSFQPLPCLPFRSGVGRVRLALWRSCERKVVCLRLAGLPKKCFRFLLILPPMWFATPQSLPWVADLVRVPYEGISVSLPFCVFLRQLIHLFVPSDLATPLYPFEPYCYAPFLCPIKFPPYLFHHHLCSSCVSMQLLIAPWLSTGIVRLCHLSPTQLRTSPRPRNVSAHLPPCSTVLATDGTTSATEGTHTSTATQPATTVRARFVAAPRFKTTSTRTGNPTLPHTATSHYAQLPDEPVPARSRTSCCSMWVRFLPTPGT